MESFTKHWSNMSLNDREGGKVSLNKEQSLAEYFIAAKFLTNRALNIGLLVHCGELLLGLLVHCGEL